MDDKPRRQAADTPLEAHAEVDIASLVEQIWHELQGRVSRSAVRQALLQVLPQYAHVRIRTYLPIFLRRKALDRLRGELAQTARPKPAPISGRRKTEPAADDQTDRPYGLTTGVVLPESS